MMQPDRFDTRHTINRVNKWKMTGYLFDRNNRNKIENVLNGVKPYIVTWRLTISCVNKLEGARVLLDEPFDRVQLLQRYSDNV